MDPKHSEDGEILSKSPRRPPVSWILLSICILTLLVLILIVAWTNMPAPEDQREVTHTYVYEVRINSEGNGTILVPYLDRVPFTYDNQNGSFRLAFEFVDSAHGSALSIEYPKAHGISRSLSTKTWYSDWEEFTTEENGTYVWIYYEPDDPEVSNTSISLMIQHSSNSMHSGIRIYEVEGRLTEGWQRYTIREQSIAA